MTRIVRFSRSMESFPFEAPEMPFIGNAFLPSLALVPLQQHSGKPAIPVVAIGDRVREGQLLARGTQPESAHIHAPVPGQVKAFSTVPLPNGTMGSAIVIQLSGSFDILGRKAEHFPWKSVPESEILRVLEEKGVINTFTHQVPLASELRTAKKSGKAALAIRLFDVDPTCQLENSLMTFARESVLEGAGIVARAFDASDVYLVHTDKKWAGVPGKDNEYFFQSRACHAVRARSTYPSGNDGIIRSLVAGNGKAAGRELVCIDVVTAVSAYDAVVRNIPVISRTISVTGTALGKPETLTVRIGTPIGDVIEECGGFKAPPARIVVNGLLSGMSVYDLDTPITKYVKSLHIMDTDSCPGYSVTPCMHCGRCLQVCPAKIDPLRVVTAIDKAKHGPELVKSLQKCHYCGCCAIVCPSRIPLHHRIREACDRLTKGPSK